jgi:hypothetical protein
MLNPLSRMLLLVLWMFPILGCEGVPTSEAMRYFGGGVIPLPDLVGATRKAGGAITSRKQPPNPALAQPAVLYRAEPVTPEPGQPTSTTF